MSKPGRPQIKKRDLLRSIQMLASGLMALRAEVEELKAKQEPPSDATRTD